MPDARGYFLATKKRTVLAAQVAPIRTGGASGTASAARVNYPSTFHLDGDGRGRLVTFQETMTNTAAPRSLAVLRSGWAIKQLMR